MTVSEVKEGIWKLDEWKLDEGFVPKPPLGIMPETLFIERRILELLGAMTRQIREDKPDIQAMRTWENELCRRIDELDDTGGVCEISGE